MERKFSAPLIVLSFDKTIGEIIRLEDAESEEAMFTKELKLGIRNVTGREDELARVIDVETVATYKDGKLVSKEVSATKYIILANNFAKQSVIINEKPQITAQDIADAGSHGLWVEFEEFEVNNYTPNGKRLPEVYCKAKGINQVIDLEFDVE